MADPRTALVSTYALGALWPVVGALVLVSAVTDLASRRVLDAVTYPALGLCLGLRALAEGVGSAEHGLISGLIGALGVTVLFAILAWRGQMGWGDVKLMAAVGAGLGYPRIMAAAVFISLAGAAQAIVMLVWKGRSRRGKPMGVPYALAVALGTLWTFVWERTA